MILRGRRAQDGRAYTFPVVYRVTECGYSSSVDVARDCGEGGIGYNRVYSGLSALLCDLMVEFLFRVLL